jgi:malate dehydrogenase
MLSRTFSQALKPPVNVSVTGGSGNIAYSMLFRIASGGLFGPDQPINLRVHDLPFMQDKLKGVVMELHDCAFPLLNELVATDVEEAIYRDSQFVFLVGSKPRGPGMERKDLLQQNGEIFTAVGESIGKFADRNVRVLVIGNPANTNALICANNAEGVPMENFTAMTRLDHNRAMIQLANRTGTTVNDVKNLCIWGNHSSTMYPDITSCTISGAAAEG